MVHFLWYLDPPNQIRKKNNIGIVGPPLKKLSESAHVFYVFILFLIGLFHLFFPVVQNSNLLLED